MPEPIRLRIGNMGKAVLVTGQAYQDPKDALNEFVSNAADEYTEDVPARTTLWGRMEFRLHVAARPDRRRRVAVVGAGGTTIIDDLTEIEEFDHPPWSSDQASGLVAFDALKQSAGRRAVLRDREAFPVFVDAVRSVEAAVARTLERVAREIDIDVAGRLSEAVRRIFGRVLRELADLDNPMRSAFGTEPGHGALLVEGPHDERGLREQRGSMGPPSIDELVLPPPPPVEEEVAAESAAQARPEPRRSRALPTLLPDPNPDGVRSRFDPGEGVVYYNDEHADYLLLKSDEPALLDYLATLVAKEYVVYNNPRAASDELAEEMVRMIVRVRRHLPKKWPAR